MPEWNSQYSVGVAALDDQHRELFKMLDDLSVALKTETAADTELALTKLHVYMMFHFSSEEHLLAKYGYKGLDKHVEEHLRFKARVDELKRQTNKNRHEMVKDLKSFVDEWIKEHILKVDKQYSAFLAPKIKQQFLT